MPRYSIPIIPDRADGQLSDDAAIETFLEYANAATVRVSNVTAKNDGDGVNYDVEFDAEPGDVARYASFHDFDAEDVIEKVSV